MNDLRLLFSYVCGQHHCWVFGGQALPFCQRCTGLYVGACCAMVLVLWVCPRPNALFYWLHGIFMLFMFPFGFHLVAHGALTSTLTGALFGFGLVYYLALNPLTMWRAWKPDQASRTVAYFVLIAASISLLLLSVRSGVVIAALVLTWLGVLGLASLLLLTGANLFVLPATLRALRAIPVTTPQ
jgi:uncharacterized membrane protein